MKMKVNPTKLFGELTLEQNEKLAELINKSIESIEKGNDFKMVLIFLASNSFLFGKGEGMKGEK